MEPEFSIRVLDSTHEAENAAIRHVSEVVVELFSARDTPLARSGVAALGKLSWGVFYMTFASGAAQGTG